MKSTNVSSIYRRLYNGLHFIYYRIWGQNHRMDTKSSLQLHLNPVSNLILRYLWLFSESNRNCFYILFVTGVFCALFTSLLIFTLYKDFSTWSYYFKELEACFKDFLRVNMKHLLGSLASESHMTTIFASQKRCSLKRP